MLRLDRGDVEHCTVVFPHLRYVVARSQSYSFQVDVENAIPNVEIDIQQGTVTVEPENADRFMVRRKGIDCPTNGGVIRDIDTAKTAPSGIDAGSARSSMSTRAPASRSRAVMAEPMPPTAPVTTAAAPFRS